MVSGKKRRPMNAKEARAYAQKLLTVVEGENKKTFERILMYIKEVIDKDPTCTYAYIDMPPKQIIAWLESDKYGYETAPCQSGINETALKISWSEEGIKAYNHYDK
jgi:hypothetical protein